MFRLKKPARPVVHATESCLNGENRAPFCITICAVSGSGGMEIYMINVFISHNCKDKPMARKIAKELSKYGIKPWIDESEIKLGDSLIEKIRAGLDRMDFLIALVSKDSVQSEWVKKELDIAMNSEIEGRKVIIVPILAGKCDLPGFLNMWGRFFCVTSYPSVQGLHR